MFSDVSSVLQFNQTYLHFSSNISFCCSIVFCVCFFFFSPKSFLQSPFLIILFLQLASLRLARLARLAAPVRARIYNNREFFWLTPRRTSLQWLSRFTFIRLYFCFYKCLLTWKVKAGMNQMSHFSFRLTCFQSTSLQIFPLFLYNHQRGDRSESDHHFSGPRSQKYRESKLQSCFLVLL